MHKRYLIIIGIITVTVVIVVSFIYNRHLFYAPVEKVSPLQEENITIPPSILPEEHLLPAKEDRFNLKLIGIVLGADASEHLAIIENIGSGERGFYYIGDTIIAYWYVVDISLDRVVIGRKDSRQIFVLRPDDVSDVPQKDTKLTLAEEVSPGEYRIYRNEMKERLNDINLVVQQIRVWPYVADGKIRGFQVNNITKDGIGQQIGLKEGDIIKSVNNNILDSLKKPFELYSQLKDEPVINIEIEREGKEVNLIYKIE